MGNGVSFKGEKWRVSSSRRVLLVDVLVSGCERSREGMQVLPSRRESGRGIIGFSDDDSGVAEY